MNFSAAFKTFSAAALGLIASLTLAQSNGAAGKARDDAKTPVLTRAQFDQLLTHPEQLLIIDVRRPDEVTAIGGLPVYLSVQLTDLEKSVAWIPKDRKIVTVSNHAGRAGRAADLLAAKGFNVAGRIGVQTYEEDGGKLTKIAPKPPAGESQKTARSSAASAK
jgi:rhodanese-related sulfurtransferase